MPIVEATDIVKIYPNGVMANDRVQLAVEQGEIHALVGENGAGKSTTIKMLAGLLVPSSGELSVNGLVPWRSRRARSALPTTARSWARSAANSA